YFTLDDNGNRLNPNVAPYEPVYYAGYLQDKIEYRDLVVNLGLRVDVFDNNTLVLRDIFATEPIVRAGDLNSAPAGVGEDFAVYYNDSVESVGYRDLNGNFSDPLGGPSPSLTVVTQNAGTVQVDESHPRTAAFEEYDPQVTVMPRVGVS